MYEGEEIDQSFTSERSDFAMNHKTKAHSQKDRKWSADVMKRSNALDLESGVFTGSPHQIAASLKRSALRSTRRKGTPYQSAMSMLNFHINRGGTNISTVQRSNLERAKTVLRQLFKKTSSQENTGRSQKRRKLNAGTKNHSASTRTKASRKSPVHSGRRIRPRRNPSHQGREARRS